MGGARGGVEDVKNPHVQNKLINFKFLKLKFFPPKQIHKQKPKKHLKSHK